MKNSPRRFSLLFACVLLFLSGAAGAADDTLHVVTSIKPIHSILSGLMQGTGEPELLVGKGKVPYGYTLTDAQKQSLKTADVVIWVGPELEKFLVEPLRQVSSDTQVITLLDTLWLKILPSRWDEKLRDPYFWLDSRNILILIDEMTKMLMDSDPVRAHVYMRNRDALFKKAAKMDRRLEYGYRGLKGGVVLAYYDTQQYFEQAYALKLGGALTPSPEVPVSAVKLLQEKAKLTEGLYACLLTEANMSMPELSLLTKDVDLNLAQLDSFGSLLTPGEDLYLQLMDHNTEVIKNCMQKTAAGQAQQEEAPSEVDGAGRIGGRFMLTDQHGNMVTNEDMQGKYQMIYFGYTYCPDVCPTSLSVMVQALKKLGKKVDKIQPYFITVDPQRDTQEVMADYVHYFSKDLIGLRGSPAMTERVIKEFNVTVEKVLEEGKKPEDYLLDHTASVYLMAPDGRFITKFAHGITPSQMVDKLNEYVK